MANVIYDPGMKDSMQDIANILQLAGKAEYMRKKRSATESILSAMANGDDDALKIAVKKASEFQPEYSGGVGGFLQKASGLFSPPGASPGVAALQEVGIPLSQAKEGMRESQAKRDYYGRGFASEAGLYARDADGNMRPLNPGETPRSGETVVKPGSATTGIMTDKDKAAAIATYMASLRAAEDEDDKKWLRSEIDRLKGNVTNQSGTTAIEAADSRPIGSRFMHSSGRMVTVTGYDEEGNPLYDWVEK